MDEPRQEGPGDTATDEPDLHHAQHDDTQHTDTDTDTDRAGDAGSPGGDLARGEPPAEPNEPA